MHPEALTEKGKVLFTHFRRFKDFYLVGGTGLALHIGHRLSVDFDFFSPKELSPRLLQQVKRVFADFPVSMTYRVPGQINVLIHDIKTTFFEYPYAVVEPFIKYQGVNLVSVAEIAAMKALSIGQRFSYKDYVDWYFMLKEGHVTLEHVIALAEKKFGGDFNDRLFLSQLASFPDIRTQEIDFLRDAVNRAEIDRFLEDAVRNFKL